MPFGTTAQCLSSIPYRDLQQIGSQPQLGFDLDDRQFGTKGPTDDLLFGVIRKLPSENPDHLQ